MKELDIKNEHGNFHAVELVSPKATATFDILAIIHGDAEDNGYQIIDYIYGISLMSDEEIENFFRQTVEEYCNKK